jgi:hypothetical protein
MARAISLFRLSCLATTLAAGLVLFADSHSASARGSGGTMGGSNAGARSPHLVNTIHPIISDKGQRMGEHRGRKVKSNRDRDGDHGYSKYNKGKNKNLPVAQLPSGGTRPAKISVTVTISGKNPVIVRDHRSNPANGTGTIIRDHR